MPPVGFEPTISAGERLQTYALDHAATGTGIHAFWLPKIMLVHVMDLQFLQSQLSRLLEICRQFMECFQTVSILTVDLTTRDNFNFCSV